MNDVVTSTASEKGRRGEDPSQDRDNFDQDIGDEEGNIASA